MMKTSFRTTVGVTLAAMALTGCREQAPVKPNILFIMADDHAFQALSAYGHGLNNTPNIDRIAANGMRFNKAFCTNSISAPSRAVILTGKFSHMNGLHDNSDRFNGFQNTLPKMLRPAGYQSAIIGKWHLKTDPVGFDFWKVLLDQGPYYNPDLKDSTGTHRYEGYTTTVITDEALQWLDKRDQTKPFFLMVHHKAPHRNWMPEPKYFDLFRNKKLPVPENYFDDYSNRGRAAKEQEMSVIKDMTISYDLKVFPRATDSITGDDRAWEGGLKRMTPEQRAQWDAYYQTITDDFYSKNLSGEELALWKYQRYMEDYLAVIQSVDDQVGRLLDYLKEKGLDENTLVVYTSDQGFYLGEHGWFDKRFMYEESFRTPMVMSLPGVVKPGSISEDLVQNLDFAPTFMELAGLSVPDSLQGLSMLPVMKEPSSGSAVNGKWRKSIYFHYYEYPGVHAVKRHYGIRTDEFKLIHFYQDIDEWELFNLKNDPQEMNNLFNDPAYSNVIKELKLQLVELQKQYQDEVALSKN
jgi:arylsulfatase A-like enzyme